MKPHLPARATSVFPEPTILSLLKQHTLASHQTLEQTELNRQLMHPNLTLPRYIELVYAHHGVFARLEKLLGGAHVAGKYDQKPEDRSNLAREDIETLGGFFCDMYLLPFEDLLPAEWSGGLDTAQALGLAYVLEGSKLGGRMITRRLADSVGATPDQGCAFFSDRGGSGLAGWKTFQTRCLNYASRFPERKQEIVLSANRTFDFITHYFKRFNRVFPGDFFG